MSEIGMVNVAGLMPMPGVMPEAAQTPATAAFGSLLASRMPTSPGRVGDGAMPLPPVPPGGKSWPQDGKILPPASQPLPWLLQAGNPGPGALDSDPESGSFELPAGQFLPGLTAAMSGMAEARSPAQAAVGGAGALEGRDMAGMTSQWRTPVRSLAVSSQPGSSSPALPDTDPAYPLQGVTEGESDLATQLFRASQGVANLSAGGAIGQQFRNGQASENVAGRAVNAGTLNEIATGTHGDGVSLPMPTEARGESAVTESVLRWSALMSAPAENSIQLPGRLSLGQRQDRPGLQAAEAVTGSALHGLGSALTASAGAADAVDTALVTTLPRQPLGSPQWAQAIGERVLWLNDSAKSSARIILNPPELGLLELHVEVVDEKASVWFGSQNASVRDALEQTLPRLREMLEAQGMQLGDVDISSQGRQSDRAPNFGSRLAQAGSEPEVEAVTPPPVATVARGLVDLYA